MRSASRNLRNYCTCFPFPLSGDEHGDSASVPTLSTLSVPYLATAPSTSKSPKMQGKVHKSAVNGHLSVASILSNAFLLPGFPRSTYAISQAGKLGLTFSQIDVISKRLALMISSLVVLPGTEYQVSANNDGDSVVMLILDDEEYADEQLIVLIFAILRLGATYMVVNRNELTVEPNYWNELISLIEPILVITMSDPIDLPTNLKNELNLISRDQFEDFQEEDAVHHLSSAVSEDSSTTEMNPFQASTILVKKIRSSLILKPSTYLKPPTVSVKVLWDLAMELYIAHEKDMQLLHFRSDVQMGQRTAFIFKCVCGSPHPEPVEQWCRLGHKAIRNRISWERLEFPIKASEKLCLTFPLNDPRSLVQIFNCFIHGKALILGEPGEFQSAPFLLRKFGSDVFKNVQRIELTPERLLDLLQNATQPKLEYQVSKIKTWIITASADEPFTLSLAKHFFQVVRTNDVMLVVTYGTPECLWCATWNMFSSIREVNKCVQLEKDGDGKLFAGVPTTNSSIVLIDEWKSMLPGVGQKGEICVLGSMIPVGGYSGMPILGRNLTIFPTGDVGKFIQDKGGDLQLIVDASQPEGVDMRRKAMIQGKLVDLDELSRQVKQNSVLVREAFAFVCQKGRDFPEIVVAVAMKDSQKFDSVQDMISTKLSGMASSLVLTSFQVPGNILPRIAEASASSGDPVDLKALRAAYFQHLGKCHPREWLTLIPAKPPGRAKNVAEEAIERTIQIICKAVAFSLGCSLVEVIDNFEKTFWEMGGSPIRAIIAVKSCLCQGKNLSIEDFMAADKISELGFRLVYAEKNETKWFHEIELIRQFFIYSRITRSDHSEIHSILVSNFSKLFPLSDQKKAEAYSTTLIELFDNSLSAVALSAENREMLGISFNYRGNLKAHVVPPRLEEGLELYNVMLQSCRHLTKGIDNKNIAKCYMISLKTDAIVHPSQLLLVLRDLIRESMANAESVGCKAFMVCTQDPLVQEVCCSLLRFDVLIEIQLNLYRNKKFQKPFAHLDDHQIVGVYFAKFG